MSGLTQNVCTQGQNDGSSPSKGSKKGTAKKGGKSLGSEWQFATNINRYIDWKCNICNELKLGGEPCIRDHFLGGNSRTCGGKCRGPGADEVATRLRAALDKTKGSKKLKKSSTFQTPFSAQSDVFKSAPGSSNSFYDKCISRISSRFYTN